MAKTVLKEYHEFGQEYDIFDVVHVGGTSSTKDFWHNLPKNLFANNHANNILREKGEHAFD